MFNANDNDNQLSTERKILYTSRDLITPKSIEDINNNILNNFKNVLYSHLPHIPINTILHRKYPHEGYIRTYYNADRPYTPLTLRILVSCQKPHVDKEVPTVTFNFKNLTEGSPSYFVLVSPYLSCTGILDRKSLLKQVDTTNLYSFPATLDVPNSLVLQYNTTEWFESESLKKYVNIKEA